LTQSTGAERLNRAAQTGKKANGRVRAKAEEYSRRQLDGKSGGFSAEGSAGGGLQARAGPVIMQVECATVEPD